MKCDEMFYLMEELEMALKDLVWESAEAHPRMQHFTGRGYGWTVQLITLEDQRIATATKERVVLKLPDDLAARVEQYARRPL